MDRLWDGQSNVVVRETLEPAVPFFEVATHLGDGAVLVAIGVLLYWFGDRPGQRERAFVVAIGIAALALAVGIKGIFALPRPTLVFSPMGYPGYTFPSAHALGAAAVYGALAVTMRTGTFRLRAAIAAVIIAIVSTSRVVLGMHYPGDVIVGVAIGLGLVWLGLRWRREGRFRPGPIFLFATIVALLAPFLGSSFYLTMTIGTAAGGTIGWYLVADRRVSQSGAAIMVLGIAGLGGLAAIRTVTWLIGIGLPAVTVPGIVLVELMGYVLVTVFVLTLPTVAVAVEDHPVVVSFQRSLPFHGRRISVED